MQANTVKVKCEVRYCNVVIIAVRRKCSVTIVWHNQCGQKICDATTKTHQTRRRERKMMKVKLEVEVEVDMEGNAVIECRTIVS